MAVLGFDQPPWHTILEQRGPEIAAAVMAEIPGIRRLVIEAGADRVIAAGVAAHRDRYSTAWNVTEALTGLWDMIGDDTVGLRVIVGSLQTDVPGAYFAERRFTRNRWATLSTSMLISARDDEGGGVGLF